MSNPIEHVAYLSQEIGPRPAGTEEEQQAALYIAEKLQKEANLACEIEDFTCMSDATMPKLICYGVTVVFTLLALFIPILAIPAIVLGLVAVVLYALEALDRPVLSRFFMKGVSQNVVAKYQPAYSADGSGARRRKVIVVANYDSGKVRKDLTGFLVSQRRILQYVVAGAMVLAPIFLVIRTLAGHDSAAGGFFMMLDLVCLAIILAALVLLLMERLAAYNEAANDNASGIAVLLEVARRLGNGEVQADPVAPAAVVHGEAAARAANVVPDGASITYETPATEEPLDGLDAAKAAIAALTGAAVPSRSFDIADNLAQTKDEPLPEPTDAAVEASRAAVAAGLSAIPESTLEAARATADANVEAAAPVPAVTIPAVEQVDESVPDWYRKATQKARAKADETGEIADVDEGKYRSRFADFPTGAQPAVPEIAPEPEPIAAPEIAPVTPTAVAAAAEPAAQVVDEAAAPVAEAVEAPAPAKHTYVIPAIPSPNEAATTIPLANPAPPMDFDGTTAIPVADEGGHIDLAAARAAASQPARVYTPNIPVVDLPQIQLPAININEPAAVSFEELRQRAPLANVAESDGKTAAKSLLANSLPSISAADPTGAAQAPADHGTVSADQTVALTGSFAPLTSLGGEPVSEELLRNINPDEIYVEDADDTFFDVEATETGAIAGPGYVDMPKSRASKLFGRFRRKKNDDTSASEWLGVDDDFDARSAGKARGDWSSFRQDDDWNGGAFSSAKERVLGMADKVRGGKDEGGEAPAEDQREHRERTAHREQQVRGERASHRGESPFGEVSALITATNSEELQRVYSFAQGDVNTEVWFVALGSELASNGGIKAFLTNHATDMRGAVIVNLEAVGAGELCYIESEGELTQASCSARMKRFIKKASQASGVAVEPAVLDWKESAASYALKHHAQAVSIMGMDGAKPAGFGQADDIVENVNPDQIEQTADFVVELLKSI